MLFEQRLHVPCEIDSRRDIRLTQHRHKKGSIQTPYEHDREFYIRLFGVGFLRCPGKRLNKTSNR